MSNIIKVTNEDYDEYMTIDIMLSNICNFSCHYCHPGANDGDQKFPQDYELFKTNFDYLLDVYRDRGKKQFRIELTGGEPSLWPYIGDFAQHIKRHGDVIVVLVTNGSRTMRWWKQNAHYFDEIHYSLHCPQGDPYHAIEVADYIWNNTQNHVAINVCLDPIQWEESKKNLDIVVAHETPWLVKAWILIKNAHYMEDYTEEQIKYFREKVKKRPPQEYIDRIQQQGIIPKHKSKAILHLEDGTILDYDSYELRKNANLDFRGYECDIGLDRINIIFGNLTNSCGITKMYQLDEKINLHDKNFKHKFNNSIVRPVICDVKRCGSCTKDLKVPKRKLT